MDKDIDREVAELMGWELYSLSPRTQKWWREQGRSVVKEIDWHPTTDIGQAFQAVEKILKDKKCSFDLIYHCSLVSTKPRPPPYPCNLFHPK